MPERILADLLDDLRVAIQAEHTASGPGLPHVVQDVVAKVSAIVLVADAKGQLIAASEFGLQRLGYTLRELRDTNITQLSADEESGEVEGLWETFLRQRRQSGAFALRHRLGHTIRTSYAAANVAAGLSVAVHVPDGVQGDT